MSEAKQRFSEVTGDELRYLILHQDDLGVPKLFVSDYGRGDKNFADADELRAWRASQHTSGVPHE
jgi:hypothetical protein